MKKKPQAFGWEHEPAEERPSEFMNSTSYSLLSGYHVMPDATASRPRSRRRSGSSGTLIWVGLLMMVGMFAMVAFVRYLRGG